MNPWDLDATGLLLWGVVAHLVADWPLQNDWMAKHKANLRHLAGYVHAGIHGMLLALVFGWAALPLAVAHLLIDTRVPVVWLSRLVRQTQPIKPVWLFRHGWDGQAVDLRGWPKDELGDHAEDAPHGSRESQGVAVDVGLVVRFWTDQVWHVVCIALAALVIA